MPDVHRFIDRLQVAPLDGGYREDDFWVWCGSVIRGEDGRYHVFASRWTKQIHFGHWVTNSEIVRAVADQPEGPYSFAETVLPPRGAEQWDGLMTHNPTICKSGDTYLLFYTGSRYSGDVPTPDRQVHWGMPQIDEAWCNKRIGLATAPSVLGPWTRRDAPVLDVRPDSWDAILTSNPSACVREDGRIMLIYKSTLKPLTKGVMPTPFQLGLAVAEDWTQPFVRPVDDPILAFENNEAHVEDPFFWYNGEQYEMIMKDMTGKLCGEQYSGVHAISYDAVDWELSDPPLAYSRTVTWADGRREQRPLLERPQLLFDEGGNPTHFFAATCSGDPNCGDPGETWNMVIPMAREDSAELSKNS